MLSLLVLMAGCTPAEIQSTNTPFSIEAIQIPSTGGTIEAVIYGNGPKVVILSNMDPNEKESWAPIIPEFVAQKYTVISYQYNRKGQERLNDLLDVLAYVKEQNYSEICLVGACRGGVISIQAAANSESHSGIVAVAALAVPIQYEGVTFYSKEQLSSITMPKLLINTEGDYSATETREMYDVFVEPKAMFFHPGEAHGTDLFKTADSRMLLTDQLVRFVTANF